jgi:hypothetical protein
VAKITRAPYTDKTRQAQADIDKTDYDETKHDETKQAGETDKTKQPINITKINITTKNVRNYCKHKPGEFIVVDLKHMPLSMNGRQYLCAFTDLSTRVSTPIYLKTKSEFKQIYYDYLQYIKNKTGSYPKYVHADGGGEFIDNEVKELNKGTGITFTHTAPHSSEQNPVAERVNRTLSEGSLTLLIFANLPLLFWEYSMSCFNYIKIRTPHKHLNLSNPLTEWNIYNAAKSHIDLYDL